MRRRTRLGLTLALVSAQAVAAAAAPRAQLVGSYDWEVADAGFGGFSGLDISADGVLFIAVSDSGATVEGQFQRDPDGRVTAVSAGPVVKLLAPDGERLRSAKADSEGVALAPGGGFYLSFELFDRVAYYPGRRQPSERELRAEVFADLEYNSGLEALAIDAEGTLYTLPERSGAKGRPFPVFRYRNEAWDQPFAIRRDPGWLPVGADFGPDGRLYLLERDFWPALGFKSRVRRFTIADDRIAAEETVLETSAGVHDNLEGIAVWRDPAGATRLTMIADDNFLPVQRTEIADYRIEE
ncbi:esterase-like activity of phytase family protein [Defluviimonas sp. WL0024]|uniref:Esterase-like activity of phytase family protein n=2 Tax=Albidovulum TaxID=205889 RepID=A0ABT3J830_9RHOB|nr:MULTISPECIES: esterase-like activity of phytase family protein [Defluviimonas]MCU9848009.1 esterase-like activity of phytase family protein [Defluviimonas sp. WL0024]MCW3783810.1 esterase-like activity of phytase family protein [Defluviimonas salinarum]